MKAYQIKVCRINEVPSIKLDSPALAGEYWSDVIAHQEWYDAEREQCVAILLSTRYNVIGFSLVSIGTLNESIVHPRDVFRAAIAMGAYGLILAHNHPGGDTSPSQADHSITRKIREGAEILNIKFLDHVIVSSAATAQPFSFREMGAL